MKQPAKKPTPLLDEIASTLKLADDAIALAKHGPKAIEGEVVNPVNYRDITDVTDKFIHVSEVANWHEFCEDDANKLIANDKMMTVSSSAVGHSDWLRERFINGPIQPTSIDKATAAYKWGADHAQAGSDRTVFYEPYRPNFWQRMHGYTANPFTCDHHHKRFRTRWICADCGEECR